MKAATDDQGVAGTAAHKRALGSFLRRNPYPGPLTDGLFFRDKMRAIHRIAPDGPADHILEVGGGRSGLSAMLYPGATVTNLDTDPGYADAPCNQRPNVRFMVGDATALPFDDQHFDMVTLFDLLEHVADDRAVAAETVRVLRPGGYVLVATPHAQRWRYPFYRVLKSVCPSEAELLARWGHVRRGYRQNELDDLFGASPIGVGGFINPLLALSHDVSFSRLPRLARLVLHGLIAPVSLAGWLLNRHSLEGTEIAAAWRKAAAVTWQDRDIRK